MAKIKVNFSKVYSPSKLGMFSRCPKQYYFYYLDPVYSRMRNELKKLPHNIWGFFTRGRAIHNAITLFYRRPAEERTEGRLLAALKETWRSEIVRSKKPPLGKWGGFKTLAEERESYRQAVSMLRNFLKLAKIEPKIEYLPTSDFTRSIDDYLDLITPLNEDFDISGKFDLVVGEADGSLRIVDFKTGKDDSEGSGGLQLRVYKVLAEAKFKKPVKRADLYFLKTGDKKEFDLGKERTEKIREELLGRIKRIKATARFEAKPSALCQFCLFKTFCPEREKVDEIVKAVGENDYADALPF